MKKSDIIESMRQNLIVLVELNMDDLKFRERARSYQFLARDLFGRHSEENKEMEKYADEGCFIGPKEFKSNG